TTPASLTVTGNGTIDVSAATVAIPIITKLTGAKTVKVGTVSSASADLTVAAGSKVVVATSYVIKEGQKITLGEGSTVVVGTSTGANLLISGAGDYAATAGEITLAPATGLEFDDPSTLAIPISGGVYFDYDALATTSLTAGGSVLALLGGTSGGSVGITNAGSGGTAIVATSATAATVTGTTNASTGDVITFTGTLSLTTGATAAGVSITKAIVDLSGGGSVVLNPGTILTMTAGSAAGEGAGFFLNAAGAGKATMGKLISTSTRGNSDTAIKLAAATTTATNVFMDADNTAGYISSTVASTTTTVTAGATISASTTFVEDANANNSDSTDLNTAGLVILGVATNNG
ncbi:MAG: hypothetical protein LBS64_03640, partial [Spirochaetaceae bacterium]|nr:hypothetical protein [Spirochaetaceae bacterium]